MECVECGDLRIANYSINLLALHLVCDLVDLFCLRLDLLPCLLIGSPVEVELIYSLLNKLIPNKLSHSLPTYGKTFAKKHLLTLLTMMSSRYVSMVPWWQLHICLQISSSSNLLLSSTCLEEVIIEIEYIGQFVLHDIMFILKVV